MNTINVTPCADFAALVIIMDNSTDKHFPSIERDEDSDESLWLAYFDATEDEDCRRRHQKPMPSKTGEGLRAAKNVRT